MAAQAGFNTTQADAAILASNISTYFVPTAAASLLYPLLAFMPDLRENRSEVYDVPAWGSFPSIANQTEADEYSLVNVALTAKKSFTAVDPGARQLVTDQALMDMGIAGVQMNDSPSVQQMIRALRNSLDSSWLGLITSATNTSDSTGTNLTLALYFAALAAFKAQKPLGEICFIGSNAQIRDLILDLNASGGGMQLAGAGGEVFSGNGMKVDGYLGMYGGARIFESSNIPAADASNDSGAFISVQPGAGPAGEMLSPLGLAVWQDIQAEGIRVPSRKGEDVTVTCRVGFQIVTNNWLREFITKRAAA